MAHFGNIFVNDPFARVYKNVYHESSSESVQQSYTLFCSEMISLINEAFNGNSGAGITTAGKCKHTKVGGLSGCLFGSMWPDISEVLMTSLDIY